MVIVSPASRKAGLPFKLIILVNDQATSAEVTGVPSENLAAGLRWKMYFRPPLSVWYDVANCGTTVLKLRHWVGDQRVVHGVVDQVAGLFVHVTRVGGHEHERVVDYERAP